MKVSVNWLKQITPIELSTEELIIRIEAQIAAIEEVVEMGAWYEGVVVGEIMEKRDHPAADKLGVYRVLIGDTTVQVCAGDKTLQVHDKVGYMAPGVAVPQSIAVGEPFILTKRDLRGEESNGMLGSQKELMMGDDHAGVMKLNTDSPAGTLLSEALDLDDVIIDIENKALTHRPDCFGLLGLAREIAGIQNLQFKSPAWYTNENPFQEITEQLTLEVRNQAPDVVPRFSAIALDGVIIKPSPGLMQSYLQRIGIRPINNVVDITNYMMVLSGQPLHAFDYDKVAELSAGNTPVLVARRGEPDETLQLLDGKEVTLLPETLVVATDVQPISLAGIMGGVATEVDENTTRIILEAANWNLYSIRRAVMAHGVHSDAATRFMRGQKPGQTVPVLAESVRLLLEHADAQVASACIDSYPEPEVFASVLVTSERINQLLGSQMSAIEMARKLELVEFEVSVQGHELAVVPPFWRADIAIAEDVVEEVGRLVGYGQLGARLPMRDIRAVPEDAMQSLRRRLRHILSSAGANELYTYNFVSEDVFSKSAQSAEDAYKLRNALRPELQYIRTSVMQSLLRFVHPNMKAGYSEFAVYEIGKSHSKQELQEDGLPVERQTLSFVYAADAKTAQNKSGAAYYQAIPFLHFLQDSLQCSQLVIKPFDAHAEQWWIKNARNLYHPLRSAGVYIDDQLVGIVGEFSASLIQAFKMPAYSVGFELDLVALQSSVQAAKNNYTVLSRFPATEQDVTIRVDAVTPHAEVLKTIQLALADEEMLTSVTPLDIFAHSDSPDKQNLTFRLRLQHTNRTLTTSEVVALIDDVVHTLEVKFPASRA